MSEAKPRKAAAAGRTPLKVIKSGGEPAVVDLPATKAATAEEQAAIDKALFFQQVDAFRKLRRGNWQRMLALREKLIGRSVRETNRKHAYLERGNDVVIVTAARDVDGRLDLKFRSRQALIDLYDYRQLKLPKVSDRTVTWEWVNPIRIWSRHPKRRNLRGMVNAPGQYLTPEWLNVWEDWGTKPTRTSSGDLDHSGEGCRMILAHMRNAWCGGREEVFRWVLAWFADILQNPTRKPDTAIMLYSGQGTGKSIIVESVMAPILGTAYGYEEDNDFLTARFNSGMGGKLLVYADEAVFAGDRQAADRLKAFISKKHLGLEEKGKDVVVLKHYARVFSATNRGHAVLMENDDRRWLVLEVSDLHKGDHAYFAALAAEIEGGGVEAFHAYLLNPKILDGINLRQTPDTYEGVAQKMQSLQSAQAFTHECLNQRTVQLGFTDSMRQEWGAEGAEVGKADLYKAYLEWTKSMNNKYPDRETIFHGTFKRLLPSIKETRPNTGARYYKLPPIAVARADFEEWIGCPEEAESLRQLWTDGEAGARSGSGDSEADATPRALPEPPPARRAARVVPATREAKALQIEADSARADDECPF